MFRANAVYEGEYLLGTSIARPLIAKRLVEIARETGADAISHGATGKGNDQVRFELGAYALMPDIKIIAPWREWDLLSREKLLAYADKHGIPVDFKKRKGGGAPYSMDANLLHISYEGGILEDPDFEPEESMWRCTVSPEKAPDKPQVRRARRTSSGDIVAINGKTLSPAQVLTDAERARRQARHRPPRHGREPLRRHEVARLLRDARRHDHAEGAPRDRVAHARPRGRCALKDDLMPRYARLIYNGYWFSPERTLLQSADRRLAGSRERHGAAQALQGQRDGASAARRRPTRCSTRRSRPSRTTRGAYDQKDAAGFIKLNALRLRIAANRRKRGK